MTCHWECRRDMKMKNKSMSSGCRSWMQIKIKIKCKWNTNQYAKPNSFQACFVTALATKDPNARYTDTSVGVEVKIHSKWNANEMQMQMKPIETRLVWLSYASVTRQSYFLTVFRKRPRFFSVTKLLSVLKRSTPMAAHFQFCFPYISSVPQRRVICVDTAFN